MYDFTNEPSADYSKVKRFYRKHKDKFSKFVYGQPKEVLCKLWCELCGRQWNEELLGRFKGTLAAYTLMAAIEDRVGKYEILHYANVIYEKRMTEDEYFRWAVKRCFNIIEKSCNPLYW